MIGENLTWEQAAEKAEGIGKELTKLGTRAQIEQRTAWLWISDFSEAEKKMLMDYLLKNYKGTGIRWFTNRGYLCVAVKSANKGQSTSEYNIIRKYGSRILGKEEEERA